MANQKTKASKNLDLKSLRLFYVTAPSERVAKSLSKKLLQERLISCSNIVPRIRSLYWWEGKVKSSMECLMILKSSKSKAKALRRRIEALHPYEVPCVLELTLESVSVAYGKWLLTELE